MTTIPEIAEGWPVSAEGWTLEPSLFICADCQMVMCGDDTGPCPFCALKARVDGLLHDANQYLPRDQNRDAS